MGEILADTFASLPDRREGRAVLGGAALVLEFAVNRLVEFGQCFAEWSIPTEVFASPRNRLAPRVHDIGGLEKVEHIGQGGGKNLAHLLDAELERFGRTLFEMGTDQEPIADDKFSMPKGHGEELDAIAEVVVVS
jgi:hypothetical protein